MSPTKVVSFDAEGTLVTPRFSQVIWHEAIPALFAKRWGLEIRRAKEQVFAAYDEVGEHRTEWYDIKYWFKRFDLDDYEELLSSYRHEISYYDEALEVVMQVGDKYDVIVISNSAREFLGPLLETMQGHFKNVFCTLSDFRMLKSPELYSDICDLLCIDPEEMVHVGDSREFDYDIPLMAGVRAVLLDREGAQGGDGVITDLRQLASML